MQAEGNISMKKHFIRNYISPHIPLTNSEHILVKDKELLKEKIAKIKNDGPANFEIMTDYDMTLTRYFYLHPTSKGVDPEDKADTSFKALSMSQYLSEEAKERNR